METLTVTKVNDVMILVGNDPERLVPIKPICEALGIDSEPQRKKIQDDLDLSSTASLSMVVASDGKEREMLCLPLQYIFGWLFTINPKNVKPEAQEAVRQYRMQCYKALFEYFTEPQTFLKQKQEAMEIQVKDYQEKQRRFKDAQKEVNEAKGKLNEVMSITIEQWRSNNKQLEFNFSDNA